MAIIAVVVQIYIFCIFLQLVSVEMRKGKYPMHYAFSVARYRNADSKNKPAPFLRACSFRLS